MAWQIKINKNIQRELGKLDRQTAKRITSKLREISQLDNPRSMGKALIGNKAGFWRYRVGDYRIICDIEDEVLVILVVEVNHRSKVYKTRQCLEAIPKPKATIKSCSKVARSIRTKLELDQYYVTKCFLFPANLSLFGSTPHSFSLLFQERYP